MEAMILLVAGLKLPPYLIDDGLSRLGAGIERRVAENSIRSAQRVMNDKPIPRLLARAYKVTDVRLSSEPCDGSPNMFTPSGEYASEVQIYTIFGIPYEKIYMTCGGDNFTTAPREQVR